MHGSPTPKVSPVDSIARFTHPQLIRVDLRARDLPSIIHELSVALQKQARIPELLPFYHAALNREYLCCTALGNGLAFPHAAVIGLSELSFAFGKTCTPIPWGSGTCSAVRLIFLSAVPAEDSITYISLVSGFAQLSKNNEILQKLSLSQTSEEVLALFEQIKISTPRPKVDLPEWTGLACQPPTVPAR